MDVVVTVPKSFGLDNWIAEGDPAGSEWSGTSWGFYLGGNPPMKIKPGERVYIVYNAKLRGYAPLVSVESVDIKRYCLVRKGGAMAMTIPTPIPGFRGFRYRFWERSEEVPFPDWMKP